MRMGPSRLILLLLLSCFVIDYALSYRILGFHPVPGKSQQNIFAAILHGLASRGHQVVYLTTEKPDLNHPNLDVRLIKQFNDEFLQKIDMDDFIKASLLRAGHMMYRAAEECADKFYGDPVAQDIIHSSDTYDAVIMETSFMQEPVSALLHKFGCVAIDVSTIGEWAWMNEISGLPDNPSYQLDCMCETTDTMTFFERLYNTYATWSSLLVSYYHLWNMQQIMDQYFNYTGWETRPPLRQLISNRSMFLVNRDIALNYAAPMAPHVKEIGGVHLRPPKPLPKELQTFMDEAKDGVIYFSLGSNLKTHEWLEMDFGAAFLSVLKQLPQKVLLKWEIDEKPQLPPNVKTYKWIPQQDVLAHKNCRVFISHGGFLSTTEAVYNGVPMLGIPFFGDQPKNMVHLETFGYGVRLLMENVTRESVSWALNELLNNPRYTKEARRRSQMMKERRHTGLEEAVYWVEYAIKYPNVLTPRSAYLSFIELHMIDIKLFIILGLCFMYTITKNICLFTFKKLKNTKVKND